MGFSSTVQQREKMLFEEGALSVLGKRVINLNESKK
jgi:hypothetical protein